MAGFPWRISQKTKWNYPLEIGCWTAIKNIGGNESSDFFLPSKNPEEIDRFRYFSSVYHYWGNKLMPGLNDVVIQRANHQEDQRRERTCLITDKSSAIHSINAQQTSRNHMTYAIVYSLRNRTINYFLAVYLKQCIPSHGFTLIFEDVS